VSSPGGLFPLLRLLADGEFHSGRAIGAVARISRAAARSRIEALERLGLRVCRVPGRGYRLEGPVDLLDRAQLSARLGDAYAVEVRDTCDSTNAALMQRARELAREGARAAAGRAPALACEWQTDGRGRRGKRWQSGIATDLTFSVLWHFPQGAAALSGLSLAVGVALVRALRRQGYAGVQLKWPNDLILHGRKLGGILVEIAGARAGPGAAVIGIGLNVRQSPQRDTSVDQPATALSEFPGAQPRRTELLAELLLELRRALERFERAGFGPFRDEWLACHAWQGRQVTLRTENAAAADLIEGEAVGVGEDGALMLRSARGLECFHSGELRLAGG